MSAEPASLARRVAPALVLTGASAGFLYLLDRPTPAEPAGDELLVEPAETTTTAPTSESAATPSSTTPTTRMPASTPTTTVPASPTSCSGTEVTGASVSTRFGPVQVAATVTDEGTICDIEALRYPDGDPRSRSINQRAIPVLEQRALADGLDFDAVSGATYTSEAYRDSLQSILDG